jgi:uncharacterized SAM-binding protein YcdF (DUF218 family)
MLKSTLSVWMLSPAPFLVLGAVGLMWVAWRRRLGIALVAAALAGLWLLSCAGFAHWVQTRVLNPPPPLSATDIARYALLGRRDGVPSAVIVVLGGGRSPASPEYGEADLSVRSLARLRYWVWLSRRTGLPLAFTGGVGWGDPNAGIGPGEADIAARIARDEYGVTMSWHESTSADTRGNAAAMLPILAQAGAQEVLLVTDASHMPRALRAFRQVAEGLGAAASPGAGQLHRMQISAAPMAQLTLARRGWMDWVPSPQGLQDSMQALHECLGWLAGQ